MCLHQMVTAQYHCIIFYNTGWRGHVHGQRRKPAALSKFTFGSATAPTVTVPTHSKLDNNRQSKPNAEPRGVKYIRLPERNVNLPPKGEHWGIKYI